MIIEVEIVGNNSYEIRKVDVPFKTGTTLLEDLEDVFYYGQNENQPQAIRSVSVGDVIRYGDEKIVVLESGFKKINGICVVNNETFFLGQEI